MTFEEYKKLAQEHPKEAMAYDFREEIVAFSCEDSLGRHAIYQAIGIAERRSQNTGRLGLHDACEIYERYFSKIWIPRGEADSCLLFREVCRLLWDSKHLDNCTHRKRLMGDTMNSVSTTLNELFKASKMGEVARLLCKTQNPAWSEPLTVWLYSQTELSYYRDIIQSCNGAEDFLRVAYTIGNFTPCPVGCNQPRGMGNSTDYWDLALACIYNYYEPDNDKKIRRVKKGKEIIYTVEWLIGKNYYKKYEMWLSLFGEWEKFVKANFMQPFVEGGGVQYSYETGPVPKREDHFGPPKELWLGHFSGEVLPKGNQIGEFFKNATECIKARSKRMVDALRECSKNQEKE